MSRAKLATIYAKAFVNALGSESGQDEMKALGALCDAIKSHDGLVSMLSNVTISPERKMSVLDAIMKKMQSPDKVQRLVAVISQNRRLTHLTEIKDAIGVALEKKRGVTPVVLQTAHELTKQQVSTFEKSMGEALDSTIRLETALDESLIGGAVARIGSSVFDGSIRGRLNRMRRELIKE